MLPKKPSFGFTLIELMFTMTVMGILFAIGFAKYMEFNRRQIVIQEARKFRSNLRLVQSKALNGEKGNCGDIALDGWYVRFNARWYEIYGQCGSTEFSNQTFNLNNQVLISPLPVTINFKPGTQGVKLEGVGTLPLSINFQGFGIGNSVVIGASGEIK